MIGLSQNPQMPDLPSGPNLDRIRGPVEIPMFEPWEIALMVSLTLIFLTSFIYLLIKSIRGKIRPSLPSAKTKALHELDTVAKEPDSAQFATHTSKIIRRYLEEAREIPALRQSTTELIMAARLPNPQHKQLDSLLNTCDCAKFARKPLTEAIRIQLLDTAKQLVEDISRTESETKI